MDPVVGADIGDVLDIFRRRYTELVGLVPGAAGIAPGAALGRLCCQIWLGPSRKNSSWIRLSVPTWAMCWTFSGVVYQLVGLVPGATGIAPGAALGRLCCQTWLGPSRKNSSWIRLSVATWAMCWTFSGVVYQLVGLVPGTTGTAPGAALGRLCCQTWLGPIRKNNSWIRLSVPT